MAEKEDGGPSATETHEKTCSDSSEESAEEPTEADLKLPKARKSKKPGGVMEVALPEGVDVPPPVAVVKEGEEGKDKEPEKMDKQPKSDGSGSERQKRKKEKENDEEKQGGPDQSGKKKKTRRISRDRISGKEEDRVKGDDKKEKKKKKKKKKSKRRDDDEAAVSTSGRGIDMVAESPDKKNKKSTKSVDRVAHKLKERDEVKPPPQNDLERMAAFRDRLQASYNHLVQEPDRGIYNSLYYHGYAEPQYIEEQLKQVGEFLVCKVYRTLAKDKMVELLCIALRGPTDIVYFTIVIHRNKQFYLGNRGFDSITDIVSQFHNSGEQLPAQDTSETQGESVAVAVKVLKDLLAKDPTKKQKFLQEAYIMMKITQHKNVTQIHGICTMRSPLYIVLEWMPNGSLKSYLKKNATTDDQKLAFMQGAAAGMAHLEDAAIVHRDIAARNLLMNADLTVKISDFGLSMEEKALKHSKKLEPVPLPTKWLAPEVLKSFKFSVKSDVWAFGVMMCEVYTDGGDPYPGMGNKAVRKMLLEGKDQRWPIPATFPKHITKIIQRCWLQEPKDRMSFKRIEKALLMSKKLVGASMMTKPTDPGETSMSMKPRPRPRPGASGHRQNHSSRYGSEDEVILRQLGSWDLWHFDAQDIFENIYFLRLRSKDLKPTCFALV
ncbi:unnamed protein product, partial [Mesorhabditis spiculigera]